MLETEALKAVLIFHINTCNLQNSRAKWATGCFPFRLRVTTDCHSSNWRWHDLFCWLPAPIFFAVVAGWLRCCRCLPMWGQIVVTPYQTFDAQRTKYDSELMIPHIIIWFNTIHHNMCGSVGTPRRHCANLARQGSPARRTPWPQWMTPVWAPYRLGCSST